MTLDRLINVLVTVTLVEMMISIGLGVTFTELAAVARNWKLLARAFVANYICIPAVALGLLFAFRANPLVAAGFLILAACPGAPFAPTIVQRAGGEIGTAVGLMAILAGSSAVLAPLVLRVCLPLVAADRPLEIDSASLVRTLLVTQLIPLMIGLGLRAWLPLRAQKWKGPAERLSSLLGLITFAVIIAAQFPLLMRIRLIGLIGMLLLLASTLIVGWLLGGPSSRDRRSLALTTALRNIGVGLVIATKAFADTPAGPAALAYGLVEIFGAVVVASFWGRRTTRISAAVNTSQG
ncbi:MAG TPA: bile acid:sodium symporter [Phycisphaerae bacterium]|nr:bile acid:sodium symporter [Phycisphaerae bacterium]